MIQVLVKIASPPPNTLDLFYGVLVQYEKFDDGHYNGLIYFEWNENHGAGEELHSIRYPFDSRNGDKLINVVFDDTEESLLSYANRQMDQFIFDIRQGKMEEFSPELYELAEQVIQANPHAFPNFLRDDIVSINLVGFEKE